MHEAQSSSEHARRSELARLECGAPRSPISEALRPIQKRPPSGAGCFANFELRASSFELRKPQSICGPAPSGRVDVYYGGHGGVDGSRAHDCAAAAAVLVLQRKPRAARDRKSPGFAVT